ncbi:hypothetical protein KKH39_03400 [Patescibacteria group bacterium]|nr:hypothetical protein [Patescibacteria group bacterium]
MFKIKRSTKAKYRKFFEEYLFKKYSSKINYYKCPTLVSRKEQLKLF